MSIAAAECLNVQMQIEDYVKELRGQDFLPGQATKVVKHCKGILHQSGRTQTTNGIHLPNKIPNKIHSRSLTKCAAHEFTKNKHYYRHKNDPITEMSKKENDFFILFRNTYKNIARENTAAVWFATEIFDWVLESVMTKSGHMIFRAVISDKSSWFDTKQTFLNKIWIDIGENKNFQEYLGYLNSQSAYLVKKIREYVSLIMNEKESKNNGKTKTKLETMIESELEQIF